jgi:hypothetical protein
MLIPYASHSATWFVGFWGSLVEVALFLLFEGFVLRAAFVGPL